MAGLNLGMRDKTLWAVLLVLVLASSAAYLFWALPAMPETVPTHWGADGSVDGWSDKGSTVFMGVVMPLLMLALLFAVPYFDPRGASFNRFKGIYQGFSAAFTVFMVAVGWLTPATALGLVPESGSAVGALDAMVACRAARSSVFERASQRRNSSTTAAEASTAATVAAPPYSM